MDALTMLPLLQPTRAEVEQIRLSLIKMRYKHNMSMIGLDNWRLYYPIAQEESNVFLHSADSVVASDSFVRNLASSSSTSLDNLIAAAAGERRKSP